MVRFSPDGNLILTFSAEQGARTWDANTGQFRGRLTSPGLEITSVAFSPESQFVMLGAQNGLLTLCDLAHGNQLPNWARGSGAILSLDFSPDSSTVAFSDPGFVYLFDLNSTMPVLSGDEFRSNPRVRFSRSGGVLLILSGEFGAALHKVPSAPAPPPEIVLALAELQLLQRLDAKGNWKVLSPDEFRQRRKLLAERRWHLGPEPQVRIYR
jgi:WD40 repeat protein